MNTRTKVKDQDIVTVTCYGNTERMTRTQAMKKYFDGMLCSEGAEHERYENIYFQLVRGLMEVSDQDNFRKYYELKS